MAASQIVDISVFQNSIEPGPYVIVVVKSVAVFQRLEAGLLYKVKSILPVLCKLQGIIKKLFLQLNQIINEIARIESVFPDFH
jgi:hypothetical protein